MRNELFTAISDYIGERQVWQIGEAEIAAIEKLMLDYAAPQAN